MDVPEATEATDDEATDDEATDDEAPEAPGEASTSCTTQHRRRAVMFVTMDVTSCRCLWNLYRLMITTLLVFPLALSYYSTRIRTGTGSTILCKLHYCTSGFASC